MTEEDIAKPSIKVQIEKFDKILLEQLDDTNFQLKNGEDVYEDTP